MTVGVWAWAPPYGPRLEVSGYTTVTVPPGVILNTVPPPVDPTVPPYAVVVYKLPSRPCAMASAFGFAGSEPPGKLEMTVGVGAWAGIAATARVSTTVAAANAAIVRKRRFCCRA